MQAPDAPRSYDDLLSDCVHCGFCLPACPTYASWGNEMDSPRGRIDLMKGVEEGTIPLDETVKGHIDACLGCMACVTACPSGVRYDLLIESTRAKVEEALPRTPSDGAFREMIFATFPYPNRLKLLALPLFLYAKTGLQNVVRKSGLLKLLPARLAQMEALMPPLTAADLGASLPAFVAANGTARLRVGMVAGCVQRTFFPNVNGATVRVLAAEGCDVTTPSGQGCCGALSLHSGRLDEAKRFARALIERFEAQPIDVIVINAAGCGSTLKEYGELFASDPDFHARAESFAARVRDVNELLATLAPRMPRGRIDARVAYHDACHLAHAQRIRAQPRDLLRAIPGIELVEIPDGDQCCGSAGTYNLFQPDASAAIGERKVANVLRTKPDLVASANPGCTLQMQSILRKQGATLRAAHPIEILDASINGTPLA